MHTLHTTANSSLLAVNTPGYAIKSRQRNLDKCKCKKQISLSSRIRLYKVKYPVELCLDNFDVLFLCLKLAWTVLLVGPYVAFRFSAKFLFKILTQFIWGEIFISTNISAKIKHCAWTLSKEYIEKDKLSFKQRKCNKENGVIPNVRRKLLFPQKRET